MSSSSVLQRGLVAKEAADCMAAEIRTAKFEAPGAKGSVLQIPVRCSLVKR